MNKHQMYIFNVLDLGFCSILNRMHLLLYRGAVLNLFLKHMSRKKHTLFKRMKFSYSVLVNVSA